MVKHNSKTVMSYVLGLAILVTVTGCAKTWQAAPFPNQSVQIENPEMGRIYVICDTVVGSALHDPITDGNNFIGTIGTGSFLCWEREPGNTTITLNAHRKAKDEYRKSAEDIGGEMKSKLDLRISKGNIYYIQLKRWPGLLTPINHLELTNEENGKELLKRCKPSKNVK